MLALLLFLVLFPLRKAGNLSEERSKMELRLGDLLRADEEIKTIERELGSIDGELAALNSEADFRQNLAATVLAHCSDHGLRLVEMDAPNMEDWEQFSTRTDRIVVEGGFNEILALLYLLEKEKRMGTIVSNELALVEDFSSNKRPLRSTIYLQNIKAESDE